MTASPSIAYADCFSGISGDMLLGALLHCGVPQQFLEESIARLNIGNIDISISAVTDCGIGSCKVDITGEADQQLRHLSSIAAILEKSDLPPDITATSMQVFTELARAEAKVHATDIEQVHFHEVGAIDTIVDIVGTIASLQWLGITKLIVAPVPAPRGFVTCAHGKLPLPAPAVCEILRDVPCYGVDIDQELVTPTGAALIKILAKDFGSMPPMIPAVTGYGAGTRKLPNDQPNLLRLVVGQPVEVEEHQQIEVLETNIDDWSPEGYPFLCEQLFCAGALDVSLTPIQMKKGRPGFKLEVICPPHHSLQLRRIIFAETSAIGLRHRRQQRQTLPRQRVEVATPWGMLAAKQVTTPDGVKICPEYEECCRIARRNNVSLHRVYDAVKQQGSCS